MRKRTLLLSTAAFLFINDIAQAQDANGVKTAATSTADHGIQDIVVTAQRRSENLQRAAVAVSAVSGESLRAAGISKPTELSNIVPALEVISAGGPYSLFYLRGVGNFSGTALADGAVAFNVDGVYLGRPSSTTGFFYDLDRVEVLKGPQGTLYGRNATGGAVNVITKKPVLGAFEGYADADYGNYNALSANGAINAPLQENAALRVAGTFVRHNGYMKDGSDDQNDLGGRASLLLKPVDNLSITITGDYFRQHNIGVGAIPVQLGIDNRYGIQSPEARAYYASQPSPILGRTFDPISAGRFQRNSFWGIASTIEYKAPIGTFTLVPAYRRSNIDQLSDAPGFYLRQVEHDRQFSMEGRLALNDIGPLRAIMGLFYYNEKNEIPLFSVNEQANAIFENYTQNISSMAAFGRLTWTVRENFRLGVGGRYTTEDKKYSAVSYGTTRICLNPTSYFPTYVPGCPTASVIPYALTPPALDFNPAPDGTITVPTDINLTGANARHASFDRATYRLSADWDVTPSNLLYVSYETGFKSGGFFTTTDAGVFRPESIGALTFGSKNRFFRNRLQINLELFDWLYKDQQISHLTYDSQGHSIFGTENVGRARMRGAEVEMRLRPTANTLLSADVQFLDAVYNSFVYNTPNSNGGINNGTGCSTVGAPTTIYVVDCSNRRPPNAPKWKLVLGLQETIPFASGARLVFDGSARYQSDTLTGLQFLAEQYQKAYWMADVQGVYHAAGDRFSIGGYVNNIFDKTVMNSTFPVPFGLFNTANLRPPRTYGVRVGMKF
ncbi:MULTISPECIES: TonB-dependent receptor [unclassified Novosphingobium]|uniref:TonB-dependent receptor n=1 Tax=unclassified Novosphingobium TaxID=2644732 RepID=UPI00144604A0|nr:MULTISPECIES: TonB-dependent receptor [unclassified Novosphingobium]NKJ45033.1 iron complex outermembrane receptor protein [Novosphingobium sp. SG720]NMN07600.1 iron complex outermembrane receptor protein [Novosphingobium sp. SG919]NMN89910.1 iron complex outermembrane receptor protein [Novosphingobium sp. SG916]